jgi:hypothetical protein
MSVMLEMASAAATTLADGGAASQLRNALLLEPALVIILSQS